MNDPMMIRHCDDAKRADWQRPEIDVPTPASGALACGNPEFSIVGSIDNGSRWSSADGNRRNPFVD